jgi:UbiD family decarboxylase
MGMNFGTYRCQIRGPRQINVNAMPNQTGWKHLMAAKKRGEKAAKVAIVLGQDP